MDYETMRIFADSWGLVYLTVVFSRRRTVGVPARWQTSTMRTQQTSR